MLVIVLFTLIMSVIAFVMMGIDKRRAQNGAWRIPEKTLFLVTALMGGIGGTAGMLLFHHKTKHWYFRLGFPLLAIAQAALLGWLTTIMR